MTEYIQKHSKGEVIATYSKGGKLKKLIAKRGFLLANIYAPLKQEDIAPEVWQPYTPEKDYFFGAAQKIWFEFFTNRAGFNYRFQAKDGKALKDIGRHLINIAGSSSEALEVWRYMLNNWQKLEPFYRNNPDLVFINSQLNKILNSLKNGQKTGTSTEKNHADDLRGRFTS